MGHMMDHMGLGMLVWAVTGLLVVVLLVVAIVRLTRKR